MGFLDVTDDIKKVCCLNTNIYSFICTTLLQESLVKMHVPAALPEVVEFYTLIIVRTVVHT